MHLPNRNRASDRVFVAIAAEDRPAYFAVHPMKHDLRHSFASRALALGQSLPMVAKLLGHTQLQTTARYAHLAPSSVKTVADRVADSLADDMDTPPEVSATEAGTYRPGAP